MSKKRYVQYILGVIAIGIISAAIILGLSLYSASSAINSGVTSSNLIAARPTPGISLTPSPSPDTSSTLVPTPTPSLLTVVTPGMPVGAIINHPASRSQNLTLRHTDKAPRRSYDEILSQIKGDWVKGGTYQGKTVSVTITFGLATFGNLDTSSKTWIGARNIALYTCAPDDKCTTTGQVLDHIEDRPMWILDYKNLPFCGSATCTNHGVFAIDDETGTKLFAWGYDSN